MHQTRRLLAQVRDERGWVIAGVTLIGVLIVATAVVLYPILPL